ncbi:hypothetical protein [Ruegeria sp. Alg231-54]|uniref:hypothetical protein n=1 Tax=Ruegeria sp. Alg231-54 TaxID=1922221 RepID=UPI00131F42B9|nr:hypothetical protein [Ruegeria sp. Alg231-54]
MYSFDSLIDELKGDLEILSRYQVSPNHEFPSQHEIRSILAPILRKWMCDNGMNPVHKKLGGQQSMFSVPDHSGFVNEAKTNKAINKWFAAVPVPLGLAVEVQFIKDAEVTSRCKKGDTIYDFNAFRVQKVGYSSGKFITREEIARFVADKMGGTHTQSQATPVKDVRKLSFLDLVMVAIHSEGKIVETGDNPTEDQRKLWQQSGYNVYSCLHLNVLDSAHRFYNGANEYLQRNS